MRVSTLFVAVLLVGEEFLAKAAQVKNQVDETANEIPDEIGRIIGGKEAQNGQFPWAVALYHNNNFTCTASIISERIVLTAAHCVVFKDGVQNPGSFYGIAGNVNRSSPYVKLKFQNVMPHEKYNENSLDNDIALFETVEPISFNETIHKVCIARADTAEGEYKSATAMGWGLTKRRSSSGPPEILNYVRQKIKSHLWCQIRYPNDQVTENHICGEGFFTGICSGDSGGPFTHIDGANSVQLGVASFIHEKWGCGNPYIAPGVFTRVSKYTEWIKKNAGEDAQICDI